MNRYINVIQSFLLLSFFWCSPGQALTSPNLNSNSELEEIPFDEVVRELNSRINRRQSSLESVNLEDVYDSLKIHFYLALAQSFTQLDTAGLKHGRLDDGMQLGMGIDLFSPDWVAEGLLKNFGRSKRADTLFALREFHMRLSYLQRAPHAPFLIRIANGLGARVMTYEDLGKGLSFSEANPIYTLGLGVLFPMKAQFNLDFEIQAYQSLAAQSVDRNGLGLVFGITKVF